jgi:hypothetical protein
MNFNNPMNSTVPLPNKEGMLITYFKTKKGSEFIEAVKLHLEEDKFDYSGALAAGVNKAVDNGSIVTLVYAITNDLTPFFIAIIQYIEGKNRLNRAKKRSNLIDN